MACSQYNEFCQFGLVYFHLPQLNFATHTNVLVYYTHTYTRARLLVRMSYYGKVSRNSILAPQTLRYCTFLCRNRVWGTPSRNSEPNKSRECENSLGGEREFEFRREIAKLLTVLVSNSRFSRTRGHRRSNFPRVRGEALERCSRMYRRRFTPWPLTSLGRSTGNGAVFGPLVISSLSLAVVFFFGPILCLEL